MKKLVLITASIVIGTVTALTYYSVKHDKNSRNDCGVIDVNKDPYIDPYMNSDFEQTICVDYSKSIRQMETECQLDSDIPFNDIDCFKTNKTGIAHLVGRLFHFEEQVYSDSVRSKMKEEGCRPATLHELLAFCAGHPQLQKPFNIASIEPVKCGADDFRVFYFTESYINHFSVKHFTEAETYWNNMYFLAIDLD